MAKEFEGILLLLALLLHSRKGRQLLLEARSHRFEDKNTILDWTVLVETLLGWIQWLKSNETKLQAAAFATRLLYLSTSLPCIVLQYLVFSVAS